MESGITWIVRVRDDAPLEAQRRLVDAYLEDGAVIAYFETATEPSLAECQKLYRFTVAALPVFRRPRKFICEKTYPGIRAEISYLD